MRQRGMLSADLAVAGGAALLLVALVSGVLWYVGHVQDEAFASGVTSERQRWEQRENEMLIAARKRVDELEQLLANQHEEWLSAEARAASAETNLEETKREARRAGTALVTCQKPRPDTGQAQPAERVAGAPAASGSGADGVARDSDSAPRFTWQFVLEFDGGWTGLDGQPVSDLAAGPGWAERAGAPSPYAAEDVVDVAGRNAQTCSTDRRKLAALIQRIKAAAASFKETP